VMDTGVVHSSTISGGVGWDSEHPRAAVASRAEIWGRIRIWSSVRVEPTVRIRPCGRKKTPTFWGSLNYCEV